MNNRDKTLDIAKGIGILLVVIGHMPINIDLYNTIYTFHVPLFFFISGVLYTVKPGVTTKGYIYKTARKTLFPVISLAVIFIPLLNLFNLVVGGGKLSHLLPTYYDVPLWYLYSYFEILLILFICNKIKLKIMRNITIVTLCILGYILSLQKIDIPPFVTQTLHALPYFVIGIIMKNFWSKVADKSILIPILLPVIVFAGICMPQYDINALLCGNPFYIISAFAGIMFTLVIARILSSQQYCLANEIERLGMNSLSIFTLYWLFVKMYYSLPSRY